MLSSIGQRDLRQHRRALNSKDFSPKKSIISFVWAVLVGFLGFGKAQTTTLAFNHGGLNRTAQVFVPPGALPSDSLPLVLILHGFTQNGQTMLNSTGFNALAQQYRAVLAYPDGVNAGWNTQSGIPGASTADDVGYLLALADSIHARWGTRYQRLFSCGFSAGGFMSYRLACERPDRFEAVASVAGTMSNTAFAACLGPPLPPTFHVRVLHIHGTADGVVSYAGGNGNISAEQTVQSWVNRSQCPNQASLVALPNLNTVDGSYAEEYTYAPCAPLAPPGHLGSNRAGKVVFIKIIGGGHTWPGNTAPFFGLGNLNRDFQASARMMEFFLGGGTTSVSDDADQNQGLAGHWKDILSKLEHSTSPDDGVWDALGRRVSLSTFHHPTPMTGLWITRHGGETRQWMFLP